MRILHLADVHLDTSFASRSPRVRARLRRGTREAFRTAVDVALDREVDVVLLAGDLFDGERLSFETEGFLVEQLARLDEQGVPVVYATGNHDPGTGRLPAIAWPDCVTVVADANPHRVPVVGRTGAVVGWVTAAGHSSNCETRDLAADFPRPTGSLPEVAVLHTQVVGSRNAEAHEPYAPTTLPTLTGSGYDYWALGHVHVRQVLSELPGVHYPGNLQGRTPRESGPKGVLVAEVGRGCTGPVTFVPVAPVRWEDLVVDRLHEAANLESLIRHVGERWSEARRQEPDPGREWMVRVLLSGPTRLWRQLAEPEEQAHLSRELEERLGVLEVQVRPEGLHAPVDVAEHRGREDVLGTALRLVEELRSGEIQLPGLIDELARRPEGELASYLARILDGAEGDLAARLLDLQG